MNTDDRSIRTEIVLDALIEALISAGVVSREQIQEKILELNPDKGAPDKGESEEA